MVKYLSHQIAAVKRSLVLTAPRKSKEGVPY